MLDSDAPAQDNGTSDVTSPDSNDAADNNPPDSNTTDEEALETPPGERGDDTIDMPNTPGKSAPTDRTHSASTLRHARSAMRAANNVPDTPACQKKLACRPGYVYSSGSNGEIVQHAPNAQTGTIDTTTIARSPYGEYTNGLAISNDADTAYMITNTNGTTHRVYMYDANTGIWSRSKALRLSRGSYYAGAVNPLTGEYVFGRYENRWIKLNGWFPVKHTVFEMYAYNADTDTVRGVGRIATFESGSGDIAFDTDGTLYLLRSIAIRFDVYTLSPQNIPTTGDDVSRLLPFAKPLDNIATDIQRINGIAIDNDGKMMIGNHTTMHKISLANGSVTTADYAPGMNSLDLATCIGHPSVTVVKDVDTARLYPNDQFQLSLSSQDGTQLAGVTTTGSALGIQKEKILDAPVDNASKYTIAETMASASSSEIGSYDYTIDCTDCQGNAVASSTNMPLELDIPLNGNKPNNDVTRVCTIRNTPKLGDVRLTLTDKTSGLPVAQGSFELWLDVDNNGMLNPTIDTRVPAQPGGVAQAEATNAAGQIVWKNLLHSRTYLVKEAASAPGYQPLTPAVYPVTVTKPQAAGFNDLALQVERILGTVTWEKKSPGGAYLAESRWIIRNEDGATTVEDCVNTPCTGADSNPEAGTFRVDGLAWDDFVLAEDAAPPGYVLESTEHAFTISATALTKEFAEPFVNQPATMPPLPLTGGLSSYFFFHTGKLTLIAAAASGLWMFRRRLGGPFTQVRVRPEGGSSG